VIGIRTVGTAGAAGVNVRDTHIVTHFFEEQSHTTGLDEGYRVSSIIQQVEHKQCKS
jgi:hypothetical protein